MSELTDLSAAANRSIVGAQMHFATRPGVGTVTAFGIEVDKIAARYQTQFDNLQCVDRRERHVCQERTDDPGQCSEGRSGWRGHRRSAGSRVNHPASTHTHFKGNTNMFETTLIAGLDLAKNSKNAAIKELATMGKYALAVRTEGAAEARKIDLDATVEPAHKLGTKKAKASARLKELAEAKTKLAAASDELIASLPPILPPDGAGRTQV